MGYLGKKYIFLIAFVVAFILFALISGTFEKKDTSLNYEGATFAKVGYLSGGKTFIYEEPGAPAISVSLVFDGESACTFFEESVPCDSLSVSLEEAIGASRIFVEGIREGDSVLVRNIAFDREAGRKFGFVRNVMENNMNVLIEIDEVEFLFGDEAIYAVIEDTECVRENIEECIPSMNNNFYIRNKEKTTDVYIADSETKIRIFVSHGSPVLKDVSLSEFVSEWKKPEPLLSSYPFMFILDGATLIEFEEQYLP